MLGDIILSLNDAMEVCVDSVESGENAARGGASRLEVCSALSEGGLTPTSGLLTALRKTVKIPMIAMLRIRPGNFVYSEAEVEGMMCDLKLLKSSELVEGFAFGALTVDGKIDQEINKRVIDAAAPLPVTFHRAFDEVSSNPHLTLRLVAQLGFKRLLTSGQKNSAEEGLELIKSLAAASPPGLTIVPAAGIGIGNVKRIKDESNCAEFHASARKILRRMGTRIKMGTETDPGVILVTDEDTVRKMVLLINRN